MWGFLQSKMLLTGPDFGFKGKGHTAIFAKQ